MRRLVLWTAAAVVVGFVAIQAVPYGRAHTNPPVSGEPAWDAPATRTLAKTACFDCHSNETTWPWYANIAPISWRLQSHVDEGRAALNFSTWGTGEQETDDIVEVVRDGEMPPWDYLLTHPDARLSEADRGALAAGLARTTGEDGGSGDELAPGGGGEPEPGEAGEDED